MMTLPPLLMGAALVFWGVQTGLLIPGILLAAVLEGSRLTRARWDFSQADFDRIWNICVVLFLGAAVYLFFNEGDLSINDLLEDAGRRPEAIREKGRAALLWFQWFPLLLAPFMVAQAFSNRRTVDLATFSWLMRRAREREGEVDEGVNVAPAYFVVCLVSASASNRRSLFFFVGLVLLVLVGLWACRSRRFPAAVWGGLLLAAVAGGYTGQLGLARLHKYLETLPWYARSAALNTDATQTRTMIGSIGRLKMSDRIILRVHTDEGPPPSLLRESSYNVYRGSMWVNYDKEFTSVFNETNATSWLLTTETNATRAVIIGKYLRGGEGSLALPLGTVGVHDLPIGVMEKNTLGVVSVKGGPGLAVYQADYSRRSKVDAPPLPDDERVIEAEDAVIELIARQLGLQPGMPPADALGRVDRFFATNFEYSTYLRRSFRAVSNETALARFLMKTRSGHCEFFATATTLLLRKAGLPTRYAVGYSVQEGKGRKYLVRERHAHSWVLVYYDGTWHDFDTTPGSWNRIEAQGASWLLPVRDMISNVWFQFSKWRWSSIEWRRYLIWTTLPLLILTVGSFLLKRQWRTARRPSGAVMERRWPGLDSEFYRVEQQLARRGLGRLPNETWRCWIRRVQVNEPLVATLEPLARLHCRYRFDPQSIGEEDRRALHQGVETFLRAGRAR